MKSERVGWFFRHRQKSHTLPKTILYPRFHEIPPTSKSNLEKTTDPIYVKFLLYYIQTAFLSENYSNNLIMLCLNVIKNRPLPSRNPRSLWHCVHLRRDLPISVRFSISLLLIFSGNGSTPLIIVTWFNALFSKTLLRISQGSACGAGDVVLSPLDI